MGSKKRVQVWYSYTFITLLLLIIGFLVLTCGRDRFKKVDLSKEKVIPKQKVLLRPSTLTRKTSSEYKHIMYDGVVQSNKLEKIDDLFDQDAVWIVDPLAYNCEKELIPEMKKRLAKIPTPWKVIFLDFSDMGRDYGPCFYDIKRLFKSGKYTYFARRAFYSEERNIHFDVSDGEKTNFHDLGEYIDWDSYFVEDDSEEKLLGGLVQPLRYSIRSDFADAIVNITNTMGITYLPDSYRRHGAIHFWNVMVDDDDPNKSSTLRNMVTTAMLELAEENDMKSKGIHAYQVGTREDTGRKNVQEGYLKTMLSHKIVVVSQRDYWEDHYRLMEALASGALVLTDPMNPLPSWYQDGVNIVVYRNLWQLKNYIRYYLNHESERLKIAKAGFELAMSKHRSSHNMERLVLGNWNLPNFGEFAQYGSMMETSISAKQNEDNKREKNV